MKVFNFEEYSIVDRWRRIIYVGLVPLIIVFVLIVNHLLIDNNEIYDTILGLVILAVYIKYLILLPIKFLNYSGKTVKVINTTFDVFKIEIFSKREMELVTFDLIKNASEFKKLNLSYLFPKNDKNLILRFGDYDYFISSKMEKFDELADRLEKQARFVIDRNKGKRTFAPVS